MSIFASQVAAVLFLLFSATAAHFISQKIKFPYTISLVILGAILLFITKIFPFISFIENFTLTPELLFYVFLPTLLFEAGYNIKATRLLENIRSISLLAVFGLLISASIIGVFLKYLILFLFSVDIPILITLLFGAIISATDPVAVIALFKEYGAPKRLTLIFEGESLFNDGTAVALFFVILALISEVGDKSLIYSIPEALLIFATMIVSGVMFGLLMGFLFSKALKLTQSSNFQMTIMLLMAHSTFFLSELVNHQFETLGAKLHVSAIIATAVASIMMGNYGKYMIKPKIEKYSHMFWDYFAYIANSLVFIALGFLAIKLVEYPDYIKYAALAVVIVAFARFVSVYLALLPLYKSKENLPNSWKLLLSWGSLRGALAITMALMLPDDLHVQNWPFDDISVKEFILILTIVSMYFTLSIKALTISPLMRKLKIDSLSSTEKMEETEAKALIYPSLLKELNKLKEDKKISSATYEKIKHDIVAQNRLCKKDWNKNRKEDFELSIRYFALGIEKETLQDLFSKSELTDKAFRKYVSKIENRKRKLIQKDSLRFSFIDTDLVFAKGVKRIVDFFKTDDELSSKDKFLYYRALFISSNKVLSELENLLDIDYFSSKNRKKILDKIISEYKEFKNKSKEKLDEITKKHPEFISLEEKMALQALKNKEQEILDSLLNRNLITESVYKNFDDKLNIN